MSGESEERHMGLLSYCTNSQLINQTQEQGQTVLTCSVQWVCHAVKKSSYRCGMKGSENSDGTEGSENGDGTEGSENGNGDGKGG